MKGCWSGVLIVASLSLLVSCDVSSPPTVSAPPSPPPAQPQTRSIPSDTANDFRQRQVAFLNHIRDADPGQHTIDRALLNEQNELGLILDRSVEMQKIPALMQVVLTQMAREFPDQDLTVLAYTPSDPPLKIGTARMDARTREMSYVPTQ